jgi:hypothetical protein
MALATALPPAAVLEPQPTATRARTSRRTPPVRPRLGPVGRGGHPVLNPQPPRLTRRGMAFCWITAMVSVAIMAFGLIQGAQPTALDVIGSRTVSVPAGGSLWTVAEQVNPGVDPRVAVAAIREANGLGSTSVVQPGVMLTVPVYDSVS